MPTADPIFFELEVCELYKWDHQQYIDAPDSFLEATAIKMKVEARIARKQQMNSERRGK